ncbi:hypothetical protein H6F93_09490, partial [Leptolyngbya sp. FACHB-671]|uniref:SAV_2336 N-terminal domain-related protein n=1 Tax=Leptolyngbya sp. FACHB-671 TaxID=2692812 RepID=UPI0018EF8633
TSIEIAETLWLAMHMEPSAKVIPDEPQPSNSLPSPILSASLDIDPQPDSPPPLPPEPPARVNIAAPTPQAGILPPQVLPVWLADPAMLTDSLEVIRALKPLFQKVEAGTGRQLDEPATVDNIARTRLCLPILKLEQEPWFDIILVADHGSSMHIWQRLVKDVVRILQHYGAFRDVRVFDLVVQAGQLTDDAVRLISKPERPGHRPSELIDQRGRRIAIVLSDCAGAYWWDGTLLPMLQGWGKIMPTVVWQMLPAWMWKRTALGRGTAVAISNDIPGVANQRLKIRVQERDEPEDARQRIPVPVVTSEVQDLARWSLMLAGDRREVTPGFLLPQLGGSVPRSKRIEEIARDRIQQVLDKESDTDSDVTFNETLEIIAHERVDRFLELASPQAQRLIMLLAAAPVITLPVVRLIRDAMLYDAQSPLPVAEVFLSGLLLRLPRQEDHELERVLEEQSEQAQAALTQQEASELEFVQLNRQDLVQYDFAPKVRNVLLEVLPAADTIEVINTVSVAVEKRWNQFSDQNFRSFLMNPTIAAPEGFEGLRSFASVTAEILEQLGGEYAKFAQQLRQGSGEQTPSDQPNAVNFPDLEPFEFIDARLDDGSTIINKPVPNPYVVGEPVKGDLFVGREDVLRQLEELWVLGNQLSSVVLFGPYHVGKTSILLNVTTLLGAGIKVAYVNLLLLAQDQSIGDVFMAICNEVAQVMHLPPPNDADLLHAPYRAFERYLKRAEARLGKAEGLIIAIDEFEKLEDLIQAGRINSDLPSFLRGCIQMSSKLAFAFAGLHSLMEMTEDHFHALHSVFIPIRVSFLSSRAARQLLANPHPDFQLDYTADAFEEIWTLTAGQPYLTQLIGFQLVRHYNDQAFEQGQKRNPEFTVEDVRAVVGTPDFFSHGRYYFMGVWEQAGRDIRARQRVLKALARHRTGLSLDLLSQITRLTPETLQQALKILERYEVVQETEGQWSIIVELFRRWVLGQQ